MLGQVVGELLKQFGAPARARKRSKRFIAERMPGARDFRGRGDLLSAALSMSPSEGLAMEFGVYQGASLRLIANHLHQTVHGFDSFEGLPEDWTAMQRRGRFSLGGAAPDGLPGNVELHKGWFSESLPAFLASHSGPVRFLHVDCDIYSSTLTVLDLLAERLVSGSIVVFDEYLNYPGWERHEHRALMEASTTHDFGFRYFGYASEWLSVGIRIER